MSESIWTRTAPGSEASVTEPRRSWTRRGLLRELARLESGRLRLHESGNVHVFGGRGDDDAFEAELHVIDPAFWTSVALGGELGAAESWMRGEWDSPDLTAVARLLLRNHEVLSGLDRGWTRALAPLRRAAHTLRRNTRHGARRNIAAHYDLGNDLFELFLDPTLTYSSGIFEHPEASMEQASCAKYDRLCRKLDLRPSDHLLEIGTGWGGMALHAAAHYGCRVTTTTISRRQHELARERVRAAGLQDRVTLLLEDYRELRGSFDKLVSIEMIEAVGHQYFDDYFRVCSERLAPDGLMAIQAITTRDRHYERHVRSVDFIRRYIFPGGCLPSLGVMSESLRRVTDLEVFHLEDFAPHYAETLRRWRVRFLENREAIGRCGYPEEFLRMWEYYLRTCEAGFAERLTGCVQLVLAKPEARRAPVLGDLGAFRGLTRDCAA